MSDDRMSVDVLLTAIALAQVPWFLIVAARYAVDDRHHRVRALWVTALMALPIGFFSIVAPSVSWELIGITVLALLASASMSRFLDTLKRRPWDSGPFKDLFPRSAILLSLPLATIWFSLSSVAPDNHQALALELIPYTFFLSSWLWNAYRAVMRVRFFLSIRGRDFAFGTLLLAVSFSLLGLIVRLLRIFEQRTAWLPEAPVRWSLVISLALWLIISAKLVLTAKWKLGELLQLHVAIGVSAFWLVAWPLIRRATPLHLSPEWALLVVAVPLLLGLLLFESMASNFIRIQYRRSERLWFMPAAVHALLTSIYAFVTLWIVGQPLDARAGWSWGAAFWLTIALYGIYSVGATGLSRVSRAYIGTPDITENSGSFNALHDATYYWAGWILGVLLPLGAMRYLEAGAPAKTMLWWLTPVAGLAGSTVVAAFPAFSFADANIRNHIEGLEHTTFRHISADGQRAIARSLNWHLRIQIVGLLLLFPSGWLVFGLSLWIKR